MLLGLARIREFQNCSSVPTVHCDWIFRYYHRHGLVIFVIMPAVDRDSSVGIATGYGLEVRGLNPCGGRDFLHSSRSALGPTQLSIQLVPGLFPTGKAAVAWRGVAFTTHHHIALTLKKEQTYTSFPPLGLHNLFEGQLYCYTHTHTHIHMRVVSVFEYLSACLCMRTYA